MERRSISKGGSMERRSTSKGGSMARRSTGGLLTTHSSYLATLYSHGPGQCVHIKLQCKKEDIFIKKKHSLALFYWIYKYVVFKMQRISIWSYNQIQMKNTIGTQRKYPEKTRTIRSSMYCSAFCLNLNLTCTEFVLFVFLCLLWEGNLWETWVKLTIIWLSNKDQPKEIFKRGLHIKTTKEMFRIGLHIKNTKINIQNRSAHKKEENIQIRLT